MKKLLSTFSAIALAALAFQVNAQLWLIGGLTSAGWVTNSGTQFQQVDAENYKLELYVTVTGNQHYSLTTQLMTAADDWDGIRPYRYGGPMEITLNTPTVLEQATDASPYTNIEEVGIYEIDFNIATRTLTFSKVDIPEGNFNGTIYITKTSVGNIWTWDDGGDYFDAWPGKAINTLDVETVGGNEYYKFTYTHNTTNPGLIFNLNGSPQTPNLIPLDGKLYDYQGGYTVDVTSIETTGVDGITVDNAVSVRYVNAHGQVSTVPFDGFNVKLETDARGKVTATKVIM